METNFMIIDMRLLREARKTITITSMMMETVLWKKPKMNGAMTFLYRIEPSGYLTPLKA